MKDLVQSAFGHAGQKCSAASLAIVDKSIYENPGFFDQLGDAVRSLRVGRGYDLATTVGPIIRGAEPDARASAEPTRPRRVVAGLSPRRSTKLNFNGVQV